MEKTEENENKDDKKHLQITGKNDDATIINPSLYLKFLEYMASENGYYLIAGIYLANLVTKALVLLRLIGLSLMDDTTLLLGTIILTVGTPAFLTTIHLATQSSLDLNKMLTFIKLEETLIQGFANVLALPIDSVHKFFKSKYELEKKKYNQSRVEELPEDISKKKKQ